MNKEITLIYYLNEGNENSTIISIIKLSEGYPCINPGEKYWNSHDSEYKNNLAQCSTFNGKSRDDRYIRFNYYTTKKELYEENGLEGYITRNIQLDSEKIYLYGRTFYGFNKVENELNYNEFKETQDYLNKYNGILSVTRIVIFVIVGLPLCCVGGIGGLGAGAGDNCSGEAGIAVLGWLGGCLVIAGGLGNFCIFIYCIIILVNHIKLKSQISPFLDISDEYTNAILASIMDNVASNFNYSLAIIILTVLSFIVIVSGGLALLSYI